MLGSLYTFVSVFLERRPSTVHGRCIPDSHRSIRHISSIHWKLKKRKKNASSVCVNIHKPNTLGDAMEIKTKIFKQIVNLDIDWKRVFVKLYNKSSHSFVNSVKRGS